MPGNRGKRQPPPPASVEQALARSLRHARNSGAEALLAARALMDALSILLANEPVARHAQQGSPIAGVASAIENWAHALRGPDSDPASAGLRAVFGALDDEIARWEERAVNDAHAQAVLAAFLGMREILREFDPQAQEDALRKTQAYGVGTRKPSLQQSGAHKG